MNTGPHHSFSGPSADGHHLATISHDGRFWEVYLEFEEDPRSPTVFRARLCFLPGDPGEGETEVRTAAIIIENSFEEAMLKARSLDDRNLQSLLRSALPD
jgi:hypothetical protein